MKNNTPLLMKKNYSPISVFLIGMICMAFGAAQQRVEIIISILLFPMWVFYTILEEDVRIRIDRRKE